MKNEFYNLGQPSKNLLERDKRLQAAKAEYLNQYDQNLKEATELKEAANLESAMSSARFSYASTYARSKNRVNKLNEEIQYNENASLIGMTEMVAQVVESALLLDEEEYTALNPEYKEQMRDTIFGLLKEADINECITNKDTLAIMEHVARTTPSAKVGVTLTEDELSNYIASNKPADIDGSIKNLSRNVSGKVAQLMEKEQAKVEKINKDVEKVAKPKKEEVVEETGATVEDILAALDAGELAPEDLDGLLENGEISEEVYNEVMAELEAGQGEEPVEEEVPTEEGSEQMQPGRSIHIDPDGTTSISMPNGQLALNGDGSMDIQLMESAIDYCINEGIVDKGVNREYTETGLYKDINTELSTGIPTKYRGLFAYLLGGGLNVSNKKEKDEMLKLAIFIRKDPESKELLKRIKEKLAEYNTPKSNKGKIRQELHSLRNELVNSIRVTMAEYTFDNENEDRKADRNARANARNFKLETSKDVKTQLDLKESGLICETMRCGLIESLAVNEAQNMLARGESYNPDLALANAIMYVTITETMNEMGLLNVDDQAYSHIIAAAGGNINEARGYVKRNNLRKSKSGDVKHITDIDYDDRNTAYKYGKKAAELYRQATDYHNSGNDYMAKTSVKQADAFVSKAKSHKKEAQYLSDLESGKIQAQVQNETEPKKKGLFSKKKVLAEASVTQWGVQMNTSNSDDLAERIRQKKLLKENNQTLHD